MNRSLALKMVPSQRKIESSTQELDRDAPFNFVFIYHPPRGDDERHN